MTIWLIKLFRNHFAKTVAAGLLLSWSRERLSEKMWRNLISFLFFTVSFHITSGPLQGARLAMLIVVELSHVASLFHLHPSSTLLPSKRFKLCRFFAAAPDGGQSKWLQLNGSEPARRPLIFTHSSLVRLCNKPLLKVIVSWKALAKTIWR